MSVIGRTLRVLDELGGAPAPLTLTELSIAAGLPLTTTHRLCSELVGAGVIERLEDGGLRIGPRLWEYGRQFEPIERFRLLSSRYLHDLREVSRATVELTRVVGGELVVVERLAAPDARPSEWDGRVERCALPTSVAGIAVLAHLPPEEALRHRTALNPVQARLFDREIRVARADGVAQRSDRGPGAVTVLAAAVRGRSGVAGAVSMSVSSRQSARLQFPSLLVTARRISAALVS